MSDQNVVTDWPAYFASLGPGTPFPDGHLEARRGPAEAILILDTHVGGLMEVVLGVEAPDLFDVALATWVASGRPEMWVQVEARRLGTRRRSVRFP